jgi:hypothetical protein
LSSTVVAACTLAISPLAGSLPRCRRYSSVIWGWRAALRHSSGP